MRAHVKEKVKLKCQKDWEEVEQEQVGSISCEKLKIMSHLGDRQIARKEDTKWY